MADEFTRRSSSLDDRSSALLDSSDDDDDDDDDDSDEDVSISTSLSLCILCLFNVKYTINSR